MKDMKFGSNSNRTAVSQDIVGFPDLPVLVFLEKFIPTDGIQASVMESRIVYGAEVWRIWHLHLCPFSIAHRGRIRELDVVSSVVASALNFGVQTQTTVST